MDLQLRPYQLSQLSYHLSADRTINTSAPSTGKTPTVCVYMKIKYENEGKKTVFVMPTSLFLKNKEEVMLWTGWDEDEVQIVSGTPAKRKKIYDRRDVKCFLMSFDCFSSEWQLLPSDVDVVIIDEFHLGYSTHSSKRTQSYYRSSRRFKYYIFMTGTLIDGRYSSAYPAIAVIEPRYYLNYSNFLRTHAIVDRTFGHIVGWRNPDKLRKILERHSCGISVKEAYKDRTEDIIIYEKCELDVKQKQAYLEMEEFAMAELDDAYLDARDGGGGVKQIRCRQILSCPEAVGLTIPKQGRDELLKVHLKEALDYRKPLLIFAVFEAEQERIVKLCKDVGLRVALINGGVSDKKRGEIDLDFRSGKIDVVVGSPKTCSVGFNWQHVDKIIFTSYDHKDSTFEQAIARGNRGTRQEPLRVYILTYGTKVEKRIMDIIKRKKLENKKVVG